MPEKIEKKGKIIQFDTKEIMAEVQNYVDNKMVFMKKNIDETMKKMNLDS